MELNKKLVICPNCQVIKQQINGVTGEPRLRIGGVLGAFNDQSQFVIKRNVSGSTIIQGNDFSVICGNCGELVYRKEVKDENSDKRLLWLHRESFVGTFGIPGTFIGTN